MSLSELQRVKELEAENARLKRIVARPADFHRYFKGGQLKKW